MAIRPIETEWLERPGGRIAYDVQGEGPLLVCMPNAPARVVTIPDCGHYPHAQCPEETAAAILPFLREIGHGG